MVHEPPWPTHSRHRGSSPRLNSACGYDTTLVSRVSPVVCTSLEGHTTSRTMVLPSRSTTSTPMGRALGLAIAVAAIDVKRIVKIPVVFILMLLFVFCVCVCVSVCNSMRKKLSVMIWKQITSGNCYLLYTNPWFEYSTSAGSLVTLTL